MEQILEMIRTYGLETVVIALLVNIFTGIAKMPIKSLASKLKDYTKVTRFIVFLPVLFGFLFSFLYVRFIVGEFNFDREFVTMWLTSSSLSLTFYAIFEKLFPSKKKVLSECEIKTSEAILESIKRLIEDTLQNDAENHNLEQSAEISKSVAEEEVKENKIILRGRGNAEVDVKK